ncbi:MAG: MgtC/SapB family protein, partial [Pseudomonadota bacterium]
LREYQKTAMRLLEDALEAAQYPTRDLEVRAFGDQDVEIEAALVATSVDGDALDAIVARLGGTSVVSQAFWSASTTE